VRDFPNPNKAAKIHVSDQSAENSFVKIKIGAMPGKEPITEVDLNRAAAASAIVAVDMSLVHKSAWIARIAGGQVSHRLVSGFELRDFAPGQRGGRTARLDRAAITPPGCGIGRIAGRRAHLAESRPDQCSGHEQRGRIGADSRQKVTARFFPILAIHNELPFTRV